MGVLFAIAVASLLSLLLNHFDNKYTNNGIQPIEGLMVLTKSNLEKQERYFLTNGWAFYPDVLLSPEELKNNHYMVYTSIGENTRFDLVDEDSPHGCGTYAMTLILPEGTEPYALELPEIFSAYKLYINGEPVLQMGNPDKNSYQPGIQNKTVYLKGGKTEILLAVSDYSHFYSGLVYPPALGVASSVSNLLRDRIIFSSAVVLLGLLMTLFSAYLAVKTREKNPLLFSLLCLMGTVYMAHNIIHTKWLLPVQPWYTLEITCGYAAMWLVVLLQNRLCMIEGTAKSISETAGLVFCLMSVGYGIFSANLNISVMKGFSFIIMLFKIGTALYLLSISLYALRQKEVGALALVCSSVFYGTMLIWDRLLPDFEPILTCRFWEWGCIVLILVIGYTLWHDIVSAYSYSLSFKEEQRQTKRQLAMQMEYTEQIADNVKENRRIIHDFRHHLTAIQEMAGRIDSSKELLDYLDSCLNNKAFTKDKNTIPLCNRGVMDALLQYFASIATKQDIKADLAFNIPEGLPLDDVEWCSIMGNLLENGFENCQSSKESPYVKISTKWTGKTFFLLVENNCNGKYKIKGNRFLSAKRGGAGFGIGLESVKETVESHGGTVHIYPVGSIFRVGISLKAE